MLTWEAGYASVNEYIYLKVYGFITVIFIYIYKVYWSILKLYQGVYNIKILLRLYEKYIQFFYPFIKGILNYIIK